MKHTCHRCGMTFRSVENFPRISEITRCAEPVCRKRMATGACRKDQPVVVYVLDRDVHLEESA